MSEIVIGRSDADCSLVISGDNTVSRIHCSLKPAENGLVVLTDLNSKNGTIFKGKRIVSVTIREDDIFQIGKQLIYGSGEKVDKLENAAVTVEDISKSYDGKKNVVQKTSFNIKSNSLTAIMGPSGCGKSTLLKMLNGMNPASSGTVKIFGIDLKKSFDTIKNKIGYVPQDDTIHLELTVYQSLMYAAKLRLSGFTDKQIDEKIDQLLDKLNILSIKKELNSRISGGQRKRVCIAMELLSDPLLLLLDEPTSPLDPQTISEFMNILKALAEEETTIVLVTHKPEDLQFMDEVIFMNVSGVMRYKGNSENCLDAFDATNYIDIYKILSEEQGATAGSITHSSMAFIQENNKYFERSKINWFEQLYWLTARNIKIKTNDTNNTIILLIQAPIIAVLIGFVFSEINLAVLFMAAVSSVWFGVNNSAREVVKEINIFKREYNFNLSISTYLTSKVLTIALISIVQAVLFTFTLYLFYNNDTVVLENPGYMILWILFLSTISSTLGLFVSAALNNTEKVMSLIPIILIPQIMLAGVLAKISNGFIEIVSYFTLSRWGTEGFADVQNNIINSVPTANGETRKVKTDAVNRLGENFDSMYEGIFGEIRGTIHLDFIVLTLMGITFMVLAFYSLRRKFS